MSKLQVNESQALFKTGIINDKYDDEGTTKYDVTVESTTYTDIESHYHCDDSASSHGEPFSIADSVVVYFDADTIEYIIGFTDNPRTCGCLSVLVQLTNGIKERYDAENETFSSYSGNVGTGKECIANEYCNDTNNLCDKNNREFFKLSEGCINEEDNLGELYTFADLSTGDEEEDNRTASFYYGCPNYAYGCTVNIGGSYNINKNNIINFDSINWINEILDKGNIYSGSQCEPIYLCPSSANVEIDDSHSANCKYIGSSRWAKFSNYMDNYYDEADFGLHAIYISELDKLITLSYSSYRERSSIDCEYELELEEISPGITLCRNTSIDYCRAVCNKGITIFKPVTITGGTCWTGFALPGIHEGLSKYDWTDFISLCFDNNCEEVGNISSTLCPTTSYQLEDVFYPLIDIDNSPVKIFEFKNNAFFTAFYADNTLYAFKGCLEDGELNITRDTVFENHYSGQTISKIEIE